LLTSIAIFDFLKANLGIAGTENLLQRLSILQLEPNSVYIITKGKWRIAVFKEEPSVLVIGNEPDSYSIFLS